MKLLSSIFVIGQFLSFLWATNAQAAPPQAPKNFIKKVNCYTVFLILVFLIIGINFFVVGTSYAAPAPDIKANDSDGPITINTTNALSITVSLNSATGAGQNADWWVVADTPLGSYYYSLSVGWLPGDTATYQGPLFDLSSYKVLNISGLPTGTYTFYFKVDMNMNGSVDTSQLYSDSVNVNIDKANVWQPSPGTSWQWQLTEQIDTSFDVQMYDIDLFDAPQSVIDQLHSDGRVVICYFSAGSWEDWRSDANQLPASVIGNDYSGWSGEKWFDIRQIDILGPIMGARMDLAVQKGCDGLEPDNIDGYTNNTGFPLTYQDQLNYNIWLATEAHLRGLSIGLKNDGDQVADLLQYFDWALTENCFDEDWCSDMIPFISSGKAVFAAEYVETGITLNQFCPQAIAMNFSAILKNLALDEYRASCTAP